MEESKVLGSGNLTPEIIQQAVDSLMNHEYKPALVVVSPRLYKAIKEVADKHNLTMNGAVNMIGSYKITGADRYKQVYTDFIEAYNNGRR